MFDEKINKVLSIYNKIEDYKSSSLRKIRLIEKHFHAYERPFSVTVHHEIIKLKGDKCVELTTNILWDCQKNIENDMQELPSMPNDKGPLVYRLWVSFMRAAPEKISSHYFPLESASPFHLVEYEKHIDSFLDALEKHMTEDLNDIIELASDNESSVTK